MTQDNIQTQTDTPTEEYKSLEEAVFGEGSEESNIESAFTDGNEGKEETAPQETPVEGTPQEGNDEKRFQYWQSQADKLKNENQDLRRVIGQASRANTQQPQQVAPQEVPAERVEEFPPAPDRPQKPRAFTREEAYTDSSSESAQYMDDLETWRDEITEYNTLRSQYQTAVQEERLDAMDKRRIEGAKRFEAAQIQSKQSHQIKNHVMGAHGMSEEEAGDFIRTMSDPKSISTDNLVQLYRMQKGGAQPAPENPVPSQEFQQIQRAQQVPSPMGVMPSGQSSVDGRSFEDKIMDKMVGNFDSKNPWK
jgi:hypothetical protein